VKLSTLINGKNVVFKDENGGAAKVITADLNQKKNGVNHLIDSLYCQNN
jgi:hypothetical protein